MGRVVSEETNSAAISSEKKTGADVKLATDKGTANINAAFVASLSKVSSKNVAESMKILNEGLTIIKYGSVGEYLSNIITELELHSIAILFDEWSDINLEYQPFLAQMIRTTLVPARLGEAKCS
jgi:hypothetical protein